MERIEVSGLVVEGAKRGKTLGFPTANIELNKEQALLLPNIGIYAVNVKLNEKTLDGAASWGFNPTFGLENPQLEVHILNFNEDIYGKKISVEFVEFIRGEIKFESIEKLKENIQEDCIKCEKILQGKKA